MSCTVLAIPYALAWIVAGCISTGIEMTRNIKQQKEEEELKDYYLLHNESSNVCEDVEVISESNFLEKKLETPFMNKELLLKTLMEHGVENITEDYDKITGKVDNYALMFEKIETDKPYYLTITYSANSNFEEKVNDLNSEYALNVQEETYLNIVEKLKENNMQIEEEEVLDDNTIVLTVNLD